MTGGLRGRLLAAFVLVAVPPLVLLTAAVTALLARSFTQSGDERLRDALAAALGQVDRQLKRAEAEVTAVAANELPQRHPDLQERTKLAQALGQNHALPALEIVDGGGRVVSSRHWQAGFGFPEQDGLFPGDETLRVERVGEGYGEAERLAVMASRPSTLNGAPVVVRGGTFIDAEFLSEMSGLTGVRLGLRDRRRQRWIAPSSSPLLGWSEPALAGPDAKGDVALGGTAYRYAAVARNPDLWLVAALPRGELDRLTGLVRGLAFGFAAAVLVGAVLAAVLLSGRIARPVRELAEQSRRVAAGDPGAAVVAPAGDEVGELARAFNAMTAELRTSRERLLQTERVAAWREMARRLAHELKNPLFPIQLSIETLRRAWDDPGGRERFAALFRESSDTVLDELQSLRRIIEEFSEFARMPRPELKAVDVAAVVEQVLTLYQARAAGVNIEKDLAAGLGTVSADRALLARALGNLVANALDAMPEGGTLRVRAAPADGGVVIEVADTGPGLDEDQRTRLFTPYYTTKKGGTGLGLAIVQGIVSDHAGRIEARSVPGQGTTFSLYLPRDPASVVSSPPVRERPA
jgi:two-component system, NtrC family, nitrogen regulation sensor histidine kinase NtrY